MWEVFPKTLNLWAIGNPGNLAPTCHDRRELDWAVLLEIKSWIGSRVLSTPLVVYAPCIVFVAFPLPWPPMRALGLCKAAKGCTPLLARVLGRYKGSRY